MIENEHLTVPQRRILRPNVSLFQLIDLIGLIACALLLPVSVVLPIPLLRVLLGFALALFIPGYALTAALFARRDDLDLPIRLALSFGLSAALLPLVALVLDVLPWGINLWSITTALAVLIVVLCAVASVRRVLLPPDQIALVPSSPRALPKRLPRRSILGLGVAVCVVAALVISYATLAQGAAVPSTEFYVLGAEGLAERYPREVAPGETMQVQLGIAHRADQKEQYRIEVRAGATTLASVGSIELAPGATWEQPISYALAQTGVDQRIDIVLFRGDDTTPYRQLRLWVDVKEQLQ